MSQGSVSADRSAGVDHGARAAEADTAIPAVSVVVPVYNGSATIEELVRRLKQTLRHDTGELEIILVNDGSSDASWEEITKIVGHDPTVVGLDLARNYGQHNALLAGIRKARGAVIVTIDDDLQHPPEEIPKLLSKLADGFDVVYGTPVVDRHSMPRRAASKVTKLALQQFMSASTARSVSAFRAFDAGVRDAFVDYRSATVSIDVLLTWGAARFASVPVEHRARASGPSGYSTIRLFRHAIDMVVGFSTRPLRLSSALGFVFTLFGFAVLIYVTVNYLVRGGQVPGFSFLAATIAIFSGIQLVSLGIIGEYLARIHLRVMDQPPYVVRRNTRDDAADELA